MSYNLSAVGGEAFYDTDNDEILFSNFRYSPDVYYFLYVGDIKTYGLNYFLAEMLSRRHNKQVEFIAIVPDLMAQYNFKNLIIINPLVDEYRKDNGHAVSYRIDPAPFMRTVSESETVGRLIEQILDHQDHLYINMYESDPNMTLDERKNVTLIGPDKHIARRLNNKIVQFELLKDTVPVMDYRICTGYEELLAASDKLFKLWPEGLFISREYSAAGSHSAIIRNSRELLEKFNRISDVAASDKFLVTRFAPHDYDPTVLAVVANDQDVYIAGVADQIIRSGNRFIGSSYPAKLSSETIEELKSHTRTIGRILGKEGYRGIFGCDYLLTHNDEIKFLEVNARKQGTTLEFCYTLEQSLPEGAPTLPELEFTAVTSHRFPEHTVEMTSNNKNIHWATYNYKLVKRRCTRGYIPHNAYEREMFQKIADQELCKDFVCLEHIGSNYVVMPGTFLARVVSVARNQRDVEEGIRQGVEFIELTIDWKDEY